MKIKNEVLPKISFKDKVGRTKLLNEIYKEIEKIDRNFIVLFNNNCKKLSKRKYLLYCFLNDIEPNEFIRFHSVNENLEREFYPKSLRSWAEDCKSNRCLNLNSYLFLIFKYGLDLRFERLYKYDFNRLRQIVSRLTRKMGQCPVCKKYFVLKRNKQKTCSNRCHSKITSERMKIANPSKIYYDIMFSKENCLKHSERMKKLILEGKFTPCVTNSWANSKVRLKIFDKNFRSSWEAYFYIFNKSIGNEIEYEKIRIPFFNTVKNKNSVYIVDFVDQNKKLLFEIKPSKNLKDLVNIEKERVAKQWCLQNGFKFVIITEEWFKENYNEKLLKIINDEVFETKIKKCLKQFSKRNANEN